MSIHIICLENLISAWFGDPWYLQDYFHSSFLNKTLLEIFYIIFPWETLQDKHSKKKHLSVNLYVFKFTHSQIISLLAYAGGIVVILSRQPLCVLGRGHGFDSHTPSTVFVGFTNIMKCYNIFSGAQMAQLPNAMLLTMNCCVRFAWQRPVVLGLNLTFRESI